MTSRNGIGYIGEYWALYKLSTINKKGVLLPPTFDYDIITNDDIRIEVKSARPTTARKGKSSRDIWNFLNQKRELDYLNGKQTTYKAVKRNRNCDFFIFVCFDKSDNVVCEYVLPKSEIGERQMISIPVEPKHTRFKNYKNRWDLIENFTNKEDKK